MEGRQTFRGSGGELRIEIECIVGSRNGGFEWRNHFLRVKPFPIDCVEETMGFYLRYAS
jgi:hypothetical protein